MAATRQGAGLSPTDVAILEDLREERLSYVALIASRRGLHVQHAERRCRALAERGLIERASAEVVYRITADGERCLDEGRPTV